jgi:2-methylisocitrate lyase-like PEP mutase family enzyme
MNSNPRKDSMMTDKGKLFRALHQQPGAFVIPNPWDIGTARILAAIGFKALATTSAGHAFSLGLRDGRVSREQALAHSRDIVGATDLPVSADLEKGFGDSAESAAETIRAAAETGLAGCSIEDSTGNADNPIFDFSLAVERIAAAVEAKRKLPEDFVLTARCENFLWGRADLDDTIKRLQAFEKAGADVLYAPGLPDLTIIRQVCQAVQKPVNVMMGMRAVDYGLAELAEAGVKRVSVGPALTMAAFTGFIEAAKEMKEHGTFGFASKSIGFGDLAAYF